MTRHAEGWRLHPSMSGEGYGESADPAGRFGTGVPLARGNIVQFIYSFDRKQPPDSGSSSRTPTRIQGEAEGGRERDSGAIRRQPEIRRLHRPMQRLRSAGARRSRAYPERDRSSPAGRPIFPRSCHSRRCSVASTPRAPVEVLFSQGFDNLYVMRIAGNSLRPDCTGSLHYAIHSFAALCAAAPHLRARRGCAVRFPVGSHFGSSSPSAIPIAAPSPRRSIPCWGKTGIN